MGGDRLWRDQDRIQARDGAAMGVAGHRDRRLRAGTRTEKRGQIVKNEQRKVEERLRC